MSGRDGEAGIAMLTVMLVLALIVSASLGLASIVDTQTRASSAERQRDSAFNLAESVLTAQVFALAREWPGKGNAATPYPACTPASSASADPVVRSRCPDATVLQGTVSPEVQPTANWVVEVHDNDAAGAQSFYSDALVRSRSGYDANGDGKVWVRSEGTAQGRTRVLVALAGVEQGEEVVPHAALIADRLLISDEGNKTLIDARGGLVAVRCTPMEREGSNPCLGHEYGQGKHKDLPALLDFLATQISGTTPQTNYMGGPAITLEARARLKARAIADGKYFNRCPTAAEAVGQVVYVEGALSCVLTSNSEINSAAAPGSLVLDGASVEFGGTANYHGVVYAVSTPNGVIGVQTQGNSQITGGVLVDGGGRLVVGSSGLNIQYDDDAFRAVSSYGSAGVVQNSFRELRNG